VQLQKLHDYLALLQRWNSSFNLTAVRGMEQMAIRHVLDSLAVAPQLAGFRGALLDVGAGAGLPGIPLAITEPTRPVTLLDSNGKKTRFMFQAVSELRLANCSVEKGRVPQWTGPATFELIISRAFASLADMVDTCAHLLAPGGRFYAMKAVLEDAELAAVTDRAAVIDVVPLRVPLLDEPRCLVVLELAGAA
jgi:16S rRNA (guanine527-N7)-methyltransferase